MRRVGLRLGLCFAVMGCSGSIDDGVQAPTGGPADERFAEPEPVSPVVRRLTTEEYARTVRDVVGVELSEQDLSALPVDRPLEGFVHIASGQTVLPDHVRAYNQLAQRIVENASFADFVDAQSECTDTTATCRDAFVRGAGAVLFRRPASDDDVAAFGALFDAIVAENGDYAEAAGAVAEAMLQSPAFLYLLQDERSGENPTRVIMGYEMASRLSYFLWGTAPDSGLYAAAENGSLDDAAGVESEAMRMLGDRERVRDGVGRFLVDWARLESLPDDDGLKGERIASAVSYYLDRVEADADLFSLFGDRVAFLTPSLAAGYGLESAGPGTQRYDVPSGIDAGGLLGQPGVVAGMTNADGGEIVARGLFMMSQLFCSTPPSPPAALQEQIDEFVAEQPADASDRQIAETRLMRPTCEACHGTFDPLGYAFEQLDSRGAFRTADEFGNALLTDGWIPAAMSDDGGSVPYEDFDGLMSLLAESRRVRRCLTQRQAEYGLGIRLERGQDRAVAEIATAVQTDGGDHMSLVRAIVTHDLFRTTAVMP